MKRFVIVNLIVAALIVAGGASAPAAAKKAKSAAKAAGAKSARAAVDRSRPPVLAPPPALSTPKIHTETLPNGLELSVVEMHEVPVVDITLMLRAGAVRDPQDLPGLATFVAGMLDEGAGGRDALAISDEAAFLGASLSASAGSENAIVRLHAIKRRIEPALDLMADVVLRPVFADSEVVRQRELRQNALIQLRDQPTQIAPIAFQSIVYGDHPYGRPAGGTEASTAKLDRARVTQFYGAYYRPNNAKILVVGDVTPAEARTLIESRFGAWASGAVTAVPAATPPAAGPRTFYLIDKPEAAQSVIRIGHVGVPRSTEDYFALRVMNTLLGGSFTSRLNNNLRETRGYTYGASSTFDMRRMAGPFFAAASVVTAKTDSSLIEFFKELRKIRDELVPEAELGKAKAYLALGLPAGFETTADAANQFLDLLAHDLPLDSYGHYIPRIQAVTAADIQKVARRYIDPDRFAVVVVGDRKVIEDGIRALGEGPIVLRDLWGHPIP